MSYQETLNSHKAELFRQKVDRTPIDLDDIFKPIDWERSETNKPFLGWLVLEKLASARDIQSARIRNHAAAVLGKYPKTCCEYVGAFVGNHQVEVNFSGTISLGDVAMHGRRDLIITELARDARVMASELSLPFAREAINDAVDAWYQDAKAARLDVVRNRLDGDGDFDWVELARRAFDCSEVSPEFVGAVLRKFIHQVKRKLHGRKVGQHLMPVILGAQGIGKTEFMKLLVSPVAELSREADFKMIADERNIMLWRSYVLIIDEMAYADRSDVDTTKHVISAETLDRRPMRTNDVVTIKQRATFMGASNKVIAELIRDETGMRRFAGVTYRSDADWEYLNGLDWLSAWRSIAVEDVDPMDEFRAELSALQAISRHVSPVEAWLTQLSRTNACCAPGGGDHIVPIDLYNDYLSHFHGHNDGQRAKGYHAWEQELGRLLKARPDTHDIEKHRTKVGNVWRWRTRLSIVDDRRAA